MQNQVVLVLPVHKYFRSFWQSFVRWVDEADWSHNLDTGADFSQLPYPLILVQVVPVHDHWWYHQLSCLVVMVFIGYHYDVSTEVCWENPLFLGGGSLSVS